MANSPTHRYVGNHAREFPLANGKVPPLAPGDFLTLTDEDEKTYEEDINNGTLIVVPVPVKEGK